MNNQEKQRLIVKIAKFSNFEIYVREYFGYKPIPNRETYWFRHPDGSWNDDHPPDFLDPIKGLGLMFKYAIALLDPKVYHVGLIRMIGTYEWQGFITHLVNDADEMDDIWEGMDDNPTTALAIALGKLIDEGEG